MFHAPAVLRSQVTDVWPILSHSARLRGAHELADLLKRTRPHLRDQVSELQAKLVQCQSTLDNAKARLQQVPTPTDDEEKKHRPVPALDWTILTALVELEMLTQALLDLRHQR